jgi:hypothetical protein
MSIFVEQPGQAHVDRTIDDDAQRAVLVMLADVNQRIGEIGIC